jgi:selenocysteine lyase/cysteine desulfurase
MDSPWRISTKQLIDMKQPIYLDHNATTPIDREVLEKMLPYLNQSSGNASSNSPVGRKNREAISHAREEVAALLGADPAEIYFTSGGTESNNHAIRGAALANQEKGKHIITSAVEHPAVMEVCNYLNTQGWEPSSHCKKLEPSPESMESCFIQMPPNRWGKLRLTLRSWG